MASDRTRPLFENGIFRTEKAAWIVLGVYTILLYATLTLTYDLYIAVFRELGKKSVAQGIYGISALCGLALLAFAFMRLPRKSSTYGTMAVIGVLIYWAMSVEDVPANRIHFFQYCPLGILALEALRFRFHDRDVYLWAFLLVGLIGVGDEYLQGLLPDRHFDGKDVMLNALAGLLALAFVGFAVREENYPWGRRGG